MADAILGVAFKNLTSLLQNEISTIFGIRSKAKKLSTTLDLIKAVLEDAEKKQLTDLSIKVWLQQLKDAVYVLDDILDECSIEFNRLKGSSAFKPKNIIFRHNIGNRLKEITSRFNEIAERKKKFLLQEGVTAKEITVEVAEWRQTSSIIAEPMVYGREDDKEKIVEFLLNQARDSNSLSVYPIVGLGGVGKTTLTQLVFNDQRLSTTNFHTKIWVCVSEAFSVKRILCSIIESIKTEKCDVALELDVIQRKAHEVLQGKRFLLVLDDVWNKNEELKFGLSQEKWNQLKSVLSNGSKGSSCLVSTRDEVVASVMGTCQSHHLSGLSENECWLLFKQYAFGINREERAALVEIGKEIAKKCGGLPLAAQALGGLMYTRSGEKEWLEIKESRLWDLPSDNSVFSALRLSYSYLTPTLKQCFAFCAIFPKDTVMLKEELIHLWMANGFISARENLEVEDVGSMIWNELCQKSFFQDIKIDKEYYGDFSFKMHDLVHDLAQSITGQECLYLEKANMTNLSESTHHISFYSSDLLSFNEDAFKKLESLRTLFQLNRGIRNRHYVPTNRFLRVLCTTFIHIPSLGSLIHLRYLELCNLDVKTLPDSISNLQKLEILKVQHCVVLSCLPKRLACLQNLRHLVIESCISLSRLFPNIGKLSCLRTLSLYIVSLETGNSLAELRDLNLCGKLSIDGLNNVGSLSEAQDANLMSKKDLQMLGLSWKITSGTEFTKTPTINAEQVLEVLQPHSNLKSLEIDHYEGLVLPSWISILSNLVVLKLMNSKNCVRLPSLGKLQSLKRLEFGKMDNLKYLDDESHDDGMGIFPSLEVLELWNLPNIEGLLKVERGEMFPCLSKLTISSCPKLGQLPCLSSLKDLHVWGCNNELLRSISTFSGLTYLILSYGEGITSFPEGMFTNLTFLQSLYIQYFPKLKELPNEPFNLALESLAIFGCKKLESIPEQIWESLQSLQCLVISDCLTLRCLPEGIRHLTSLETLAIVACPILKERCKEGTGEDWDKIAHIPNLYIP